MHGLLTLAMGTQGFAAAWALARCVHAFWSCMPCRLQVSMDIRISCGCCLGAFQSAAVSANACPMRCSGLTFFYV